jgi:glycosyltransferase involved in cell wall biosynthesis
LGVVQVSVSDSVKQNEQIRFGNPTHLINNWYDDAYFTPPSLQERIEARKTQGLSGNEKVIVSIGNCAPVKNHALIIQALSLLKNNGLFPLYWHVGEEDAEEKERSLVRKLDLDTQVHFWGRQDDVRPFLWAADVFVMPSLREGFSVSALEAIACSLPTILTDVPGLLDWKKFGIKSIIYSEANPTALAENINTAFENPNRPSFQELEKIFEKYKVLAGVNSYNDLYKLPKNKSKSFQQ